MRKRRRVDALDIKITTVTVFESKVRWRGVPVWPLKSVSPQLSCHLPSFRSRCGAKRRGGGGMEVNDTGRNSGCLEEMKVGRQHATLMGLN